MPSCEPSCGRAEECFSKRRSFRACFNSNASTAVAAQTFKPKAALDQLFPLKVGQQGSAEFDVQEGDKPPVNAKFSLNVKAKDALYIGACRYDVLRVEMKQTRGGRNAAAFNRLLFAPPEAGHREGIQGARRANQLDQV
jgi:hypothetical protein